MAKNCCVCDERIGAFDKPKQLIEGDGERLLCVKCGDMIGDARASGIDPANRNAVAYHNRAVDYFARCMAARELDPAVMANLASIPDISEKWEQAASKKAEAQENERRYREEKGSVLATTGFDFQGHRVTAYHKVVSADAIIGTGPLAETAAAVADLVGEKSGALGRKVAQAKEQAYEDMLKQAILAGGNAVLGVSYGVYVAGSMLGASATGTSVTIAECSDDS